MSVLNHNIMYIFPGQGSQYKGMGSEICADFKVARRIYDRASEVLGYDIAELSFNDREGRLGLTEFTQSALLTHSIACLEVFKELTDNTLNPAVTAGHSLGEYSALIAAGSLTLENALQLVQKRGELMRLYGKGKMVALGLDVTTVRSFVSRFYCDVGGCNLPNQTVVGGSEQDLQSFAEYVKSNFGIVATYLNTAGAFHTYLMTYAAEEFRPVLDSTDLKPPMVRVLSNYSGRYHSPDSSTIKAHLFFQLFNPVKWIWGMQEALKDGINIVIEFGGGIGKGNTPISKRPNLEGVTRRALKSSGYYGIYLPCINSNTIKESAHFFRVLDKVVDEPHDEPGNAVDENWVHLFLPTRNGAVTENSIDLLCRVDELGLTQVVQLIAMSTENDQELKARVLEGPQKAQPYLELFAGCESAALLHYWGDDIEQELVALRKRLERPGYEFPQR
jgi:malonyl CoA-acyl carrier protein transacylase